MLCTSSIHEVSFLNFLERSESVEMLGKMLRAISRGMSKVSDALVLALIAIICTDVVARYVFNSPIAWVYEMSYICGAFIAATGIGQLMLDDGNVRVDMFYAKYSPKVKLIVDILFAICLFLPAYTALGSAVIRNCITAFQTGETSVITTWYPKLWPIKLVLCVGIVVFLLDYVLITVEKIGKLIRLWKGAKN